MGGGYELPKVSNKQQGWLFTRIGFIKILRAKHKGRPVCKADKIGQFCKKGASSATKKNNIKLRVAKNVSRSNRLHAGMMKILHLHDFPFSYFSPLRNLEQLIKLKNEYFIAYSKDDRQQGYKEKYRKMRNYLVQLPAPYTMKKSNRSKL